MPNGLVGKLLGGAMKKFSGARSKVFGEGSGSSKPPSAGPQIGIVDAAASSPAQGAWASRSGVNGTTSPKGIGKWGVGA